ncbi:Chromo domain-containing protein [Gossypium australe]|uniref:Chromo domain-containing protein n=1 Tax=Gossypium australe TaxID=47621 RepID=A0A5B6UYJ5_9ROSI|nr:Chromo domain-containing protein [Gossypium australe]
MDFVSRLLLSSKNKDVICVIVDRLMKSVTLFQDPQFTSRFWSKLQEALGTQLDFSIAFHSQTDDQCKHVIQILEDMLRCCILEFEGNWEKYLPLVEFAYNNSHQ